MGPAIGGSLVMAIGISITPVAIVAALLLLKTPRARTNGPAFLAGWLVGLGITGGIALAVLGSTHASHAETPAMWVSWLRIVLGVLLLCVALFEVWRRPKLGPAVHVPQLSGNVDKIRSPMVLGLGAVLAGARPKNLLLVVAGAAAIAQTGIPAGEQAIAYVVFAMIATIGVAIPVVLYFSLGPRAPEVLGGLEGWIRRNHVPIISVLCLVVGVDLIGGGISMLT